MVFGVGFEAPVHAQGSAIRALVVGDSITWWNPTYAGYGPAFVRKFEARGLGAAEWRSEPGSSPCSAPWATWIRDYPEEQIDVVVLEDDYRTGACSSTDAWRLAWQDTVNAAKSKGAYVIVLEGTHPDLSSVSGIDILDYPVPPPDWGDGVHYSSGGYKLYARSVVNLLDFLAG